MRSLNDRERWLQFSIFFIYTTAIVTRVLMLFEDIPWPQRLVPAVVLCMDVACLACAFNGNSRIEKRILTVNVSMGFSDAILWSLVVGESCSPELTMLRYELPAMMLYRRLSLDWMGDDE